MQMDEYFEIEIEIRKRADEEINRVGKEKSNIKWSEYLQFILVDVNFRYVLCPFSIK